MHEAFRAGKTYSAEWKSSCKNCSFYDVCLPEAFSRKKTVRDYIDENIKPEMGSNKDEIKPLNFPESQI